MPRVNGTNNRQTSFLRAFRTHPGGPPPSLWPSPSILRRWLRRPAFKRALDSLLQTLRFQSDFQLAALSAQATSAYATPSPTNGRARFSERNDDASQDSALTTQDFSKLLRLAHLRQRFTTEKDNTIDHNPPPVDDDGKPKNNLELAQDAFNKLNPNHRRLFLNQLADEDKTHIATCLPNPLFFKIAWSRGCAKPLETLPDFPAPTQPDLFYYRLLLNTQAILHFMDLYDKANAGKDHRFNPILNACRHLVPSNHPANTNLPKLAHNPT